MAWSKCNKNCIVTGPLDAFCLVCNSHLQSEDDLDAHFEKPIHKNNLESAQYVEKYNDNHIRKVKKGYYCEFCNLLLITAAKVGLHIKEAHHQHNKGTQLLERVNNSVIAFNDILIDERSWNGFVENTCTVCNTEFENGNTHKTGQDHTLNLILKKIEFIDDKLIYRRIDETSYQCLICNLVLAIRTLDTHVDQADHIKKLRISRQPSTGTQDNIGVTATAKEQDTQKRVSQMSPSFLKTLDYNSSNSKITTKVENKESKKTELKKSSKNDMKDPVEFEKYICTVLGAKNYIVAHEQGKSMCLLCDWFMDTETAAAHVAGRHHLTILKMHRRRLEMMANGDNPKPKLDEAKSKVDRPSDQKPKIGNSNSKTDKQNTNGSKTDDDKDKIVDSLLEFQANNIDIDFLVSKAICKKCCKTLDLEYDVIQNHISEHKKSSNQENAKLLDANKTQAAKPGTKSMVSRRTEEGRSSRASSVSSTPDDGQIEVLAKEHKMIHKNSKMFCSLCNTEVPLAVKNMRDHVAGAQHKKLLAKPTGNDLLKSPKLTKLSSKQFITSLIGVENALVQDVIVNERFNINMMSFLMITSENFTLKCQLCEMVLRPPDLHAHKTTSNHVRALAETMVVTSVENEFVREPRPDVFHCGFCCSVTHGWDELEDHLASNSHRGKKTAAMWRLREHLGQISRERWQRTIGFMSFMNNYIRHHDSSDDEHGAWY